jgi:DNA-binding response OmpR family regulator
MDKVLIIDDDHMVSFTLSLILTEAGYDVAVAANGQHGMALLRAEQPAIVVTDLMMPEQDGIETIIQIRREHPEIKILAISGGGRLGISISSDRRTSSARTIRSPSHSNPGSC